jgi:hypothetical protein
MLGKTFLYSILPPQIHKLATTDPQNYGIKNKNPMAFSANPETIFKVERFYRRMN